MTQEVLVTHRNSPSLRRILFTFYTSIFHALTFHLSKSRKYLTKVLAFFCNMLNVFKIQWKIKWFMLLQRKHKQRGVSSASLVSKSRLLRKPLDSEGFSWIKANRALLCAGCSVFPGRTTGEQVIRRHKNEGIKIEVASRNWERSS